MLDLREIRNIDISEIKNIMFDLGIFASGYEERSSYLARNINKESISQSLIFGFSEFIDNETRVINDDFYSDEYTFPIVIRADEEEEVYKQLSTVFDGFSAKKQINILIDYTSMSRFWYACILNFIKCQTDIEIDVYLNYSLGEYKDNLHEYSYSSINSLPSHEGLLSANTRTLLVFAVGFYPELAQSVIEEIEPNDIIGILSIPSLKKEYEERSIKTMKSLEKEIDNWIKCPINNLENIFRTYSEITSNNIDRKDILLLSLGPKVFTMASILVSQRFEQVTCLYLKSSYNELNNIEATGDCICNMVIYK